MTETMPTQESAPGESTPGAAPANTPADGFEASPLARDLRDFAGRNADTMLVKMRSGLKPDEDPENTAKRRRGLSSWVWPAFFVTFVWFFYRRMYLEGAGFIVLPIILALLLPNVVTSGTVVGVLAALMVGQLYLIKARRRIAKADSQELTGEARSAFLAAGGGVSVGGAIFGAVIFAAMIALTILARTIDPGAM